MVLDDEPYNVMVVRKYLRDVGYSNLLECTDSSAAMNIIAAEKTQPPALGHHDAQSERAGHPSRPSIA